MFRQERTHAHAHQLFVNADDLLFLLDLSQMPAARRHEIGYKASYAITDILVRMELPPLESVPDWDSFDKSAPSAWRIPGTPITMVRIDEGPRAGEYLFSARTVALAVRPSLENLMGGVILFVDKPVRVGDFCSFGSYMGTVENIDIRSTKIRALDRTLISIPNATFVDMELINWAECDQMLILTVIGLRYETTPDQLRYVLATLSEMLYAHPKIDRSTVRVRYVGYGTSSRDLEIHVYALTQEWNEFYAIREDVFLRVDQVVAESGTSFAFPSQTLYFGCDDGLDQDRSESAEQMVGDWRRTGTLPFPDSASGRVDDLAGTLDYPPRGSVEEYRPDAGEASESEQLSTLPSPAESEDKHTTDKQ